MTAAFDRRRAGPGNPKRNPPGKRSRRRGLLAIVTSVAVVAGVGVTWLLLPERDPNALTAQPIDAVPIPTGESVPVNVAPAAPSLAKAVARRDTVAPAEVDRLPTDPELSEPIVEEQTGQFQKLYESWNAEPTDADATREMEAYFRGAFATFDIRPKGVDVRCTQWVCRARFRFDELSELYEMTKIDEADGTRIATTFPEEGEDGSRSVSVYFSRNERPEGSLTNTLGR